MAALFEGIDEAIVEKSRHEEECFVLITNIDKTELSRIEVLRQYKEQTLVEVQFKLLKEP